MLLQGCQASTAVDMRCNSKGASPVLLGGLPDVVAVDSPQAAGIYIAVQHDFGWGRM